MNHVAGATSFECLRTVDGKILPTFHEAVERRVIIEEDNSLDESLSEATRWMMPYALQRLFATILVFYEPNDVFGLWEKHKEAMSEDYRRNNQSNFMVEQMFLIDIQKMLQSMQKDIKMYPLPDIDDTYDPSGDIPREIFEETSVEASDIPTMRLCMLLIAIMGVCSLWMDLAALVRLIYTGPCSLLYVVRTRLLWLQQHLVLLPQ